MTIRSVKDTLLGALLVLAIVTSIPIAWIYATPIIGLGGIDHHASHEAIVFVHAIGGVGMLGLGAAALYIGWTRRGFRYHRWLETDQRPARSCRGGQATVRKGIRRDDMFARVGGDEFLIFMPVRDHLAAETVALRLHGQMNSISDDTGACLRCSVGGLIVPPGEMHMGQLVRLADRLMYRGKLLGGCLQVEVVHADSEKKTSGRARKAARAPLLGATFTRKPQNDRRSPKSEPSGPGAAPFPAA